MNRLQRRLSKLEGPIAAGEEFSITIQLIEPGTTRVTSRLRLIPGGGSVKIDQDGNEIEARITALAARQ
ncbi:hypothetical protein [Candidatus Accumulibacter phosphatis]|uniref:Uncharacterized protein n=1 Tax=Candidatus Accumulibacter phosphatis TaxID=327160 RepID=A0A5S4ERR1_9PROT|nr:hypothetical protein [Candidatus Accumulibacter phosphatis]MCC2868072.1 hypothetical protein [Candidatus Accumulibacter phosphatis]TMQ78176.1 hypothetical protein ACCUM_2260 [Candidatus Accumulibacter phosphatis]